MHPRHNGLADPAVPFCATVRGVLRKWKFIQSGLFQEEGSHIDHTVHVSYFKHGSSGAEDGLGTPDEDYDYKALRKKILETWGQSTPEGNGEEDNTSPDTTSPDSSIGRKAQDESSQNEAPVQDPEPVKRRNVSEPETAPAPKREYEPARVKTVPEIKTPLPERKMPDKAKAHVKKKIAEPAQMEASSNPDSEGLIPRRWSEKDAQRWMVYDAVFGPPRGRAGWKYRR